MTDIVRKLILDIYDAMFDPLKWTSVLDSIVHAVNAKGCVVFALEGVGENRRLSAEKFSSYHHPDLLQAYIECFRTWELADQDRFESRSLATNRIDLIDDSVLAPDDQTLFALPNVQQLLDYGIRHRHAGLLNKDNRTRSRFSVQLDSNRGRLTPHEEAILSELLPHVAKALDLGRTAEALATRHRQMIEAMDHLRIGIAILDQCGRLVVSNAEFQRQCDAYGAFGTDAVGRLRLHSAADQDTFIRLLDGAANHGRFGARPRKEALATLSNDAVGYLSIEVAPLSRVEAMGSRPLDGSVVYSVDTSIPMTYDPFLVQRIFELSPAETALVDMISMGMTNAEIAASRGRSVATVNAQVKSVLTKTDCSNRTELGRLLMDFGADFLTRADPDGDHDHDQDPI